MQKGRKKHGLTFCTCEKVDQTLFLPIFNAKSQRRKKVRLFALQKVGKKHKSAFLYCKKAALAFCLPVSIPKQYVYCMPITPICNKHPLWFFHVFRFAKIQNICKMQTKIRRKYYI
jgi:hypothetical protein